MYWVIKNYLMFKINLFFEKIFDEFISFNNFLEDEVCKVSIYLRNFFVDIVDVFVFGKIVDFVYLIDDVNIKKYNSVFNELFNYIFIFFFVKFIKKVFVGFVIGVIFLVMVRMIFD